ncbi:MAG: copper resistance CopC family protein [Pseudohongiellaceae bacterium]
MKQPSHSCLTASRFVACTLFTLLFSSAAFAHTALQQSMPGNGAIVRDAPGHINLTFNGPVKLVKLELMGVGHEMPTNFSAGREAKATFMIETPGMHPGAFTVNWAAIGADGHTVADSYSFTVDPNATDEQLQSNDGAARGDH